MRKLIYKWSRTGRYHIDNKIDNQDYIYASENEDTAVITLADGVSTCGRAAEGAIIAGYALAGILSAKGRLLMEYSSDEIADIVVSHMLYELRDAAEAESVPLYEYSSTAAGVMYDKSSGRLLCFNLGDGMILGVKDGDLRILSMPCDSSDGCIVTTTERAAGSAAVRIIETGETDAAIICSDGAWREMFRSVRVSPEAEELIVKGDYQGLGSYLESRGCADDNSFISMDIIGERGA